MSEYQGLIPLMGTSAIFVTKSGHFTQFLTYDYLDKGQTTKFGKSYFEYIENPLNRTTELELNKNNLQYFLNEEKNRINGKEIAQTVDYCTIQFRTRKQPFVTYIIEFEGKFHPGVNIYENIITPEILEYPIHSVYSLEAPLRLIDVETNLDVLIDSTHQNIEFHGEKGRKIGPKEVIRIQL